MAEFRSPSFAKLLKKLDRAQSELAKLANHAARRRDAILSEDWEATTAAATGLADFLRSLADRGLRGVKPVIADNDKGLRAAARRVFNAMHQRCRIPWMRKALAHAPTTHGGCGDVEDDLRSGNQS